MVRKSPTPRSSACRCSRDDGKYEGTLFDVAAPVEYFVEANGVRSPDYTLKVVDMPYVQQLELEYHFPAYTGPAAAEDRRRRRHRGPPRHRDPRPRGADDGGAGRRDRRSTTRTARCRCAVAGRRRADRRRSRSTRRLLPHRARRARRASASPPRRSTRSTCSTDQPPTVSIREAGARHLGVADRGSVRRGEGRRRLRRQAISTSSTGSTAARRRRSGCSTARSGMPKVSAGHTLYLEELGVKPGDFVSYYARAGDNDARRRVRRRR